MADGCMAWEWKYLPVTHAYIGLKNPYQPPEPDYDEHGELIIPDAIKNKDSFKEPLGKGWRFEEITHDEGSWYAYYTRDSDFEREGFCSACNVVVAGR